MNETTSKNSSWKYFPEKIILFASQFENTNDEFERLIGYLLLDVGVENLLKTYVLDSNLKYGKREASTKGIVRKEDLPNSITTVNFDKLTFHNLVEAARDASESSVTDDDFKNAEHFHGIRNVIYHEGKKTIPPKQDFLDYLTLAKLFLNKLLGIEWKSPVLNPEQKENPLSKDVDPIDALGYIFFDPKQEINNLRRDISVAIALLRPKYATKSFEEKIKELWSDYANTLTPRSGVPSSVYDFAESELIKKFNDLTEQKIKDADFILEMCNDVTLLQFGVLLTQLGVDVRNETNNYLKFRNYGRKQNYKEITNEDVKRSGEFNTWVHAIEEKINSFIEEKASNS